MIFAFCFLPSTWKKKRKTKNEKHTRDDQAADDFFVVPTYKTCYAICKYIIRLLALVPRETNNRTDDKEHGDNCRQCERGSDG
jgi:hypothetical protein